MTWIKTIPYEQATGKLHKVYKRVVGPDGNVDNILMSHSLRPATLQGHMTLYKNVLHHSEMQLPKWLREAIGTWVSLLNGCNYCVEHHHAGMARLLDDPAQAAEIRTALEARQPEQAFDPAHTALFEYARLLTQQPATMQQQHVQTLRDHGWDDGAILETNQVAAYFAYANRTVLGLGVNTQGDELGLSPNDSDDPNNWNHS